MNLQSALNTLSLIVSLCDSNVTSDVHTMGRRLESSNLYYTMSDTVSQPSQIEKRSAAQISLYVRQLRSMRDQ